MAGVVFVLGAGASFGERLRDVLVPEGGDFSVRPPMIGGFFSKHLWEQIGYTTADRDFPDALAYIRYLKQITANFGEGVWETVNLEEVFTAIELEREFQGIESDAGAKLTLCRNQLVRYIARIIGFCTQDKYGEYARLLASSLTESDSVISFNYDLLLDQELMAKSQFELFVTAVFMPGADHAMGDVINQDSPDNGVYLKMHGSLNWMRCTNPKCPRHSVVHIMSDMQKCLNRAIGIHVGDESCVRCGSENIALLIPPIVRKPIGDSWIFRSIWGLARHRLEEATAVVIIGFSLPPSDFYAAWLLQSTVGVRTGVPIYVVNPMNKDDHAQHSLFRSRMQEIFPHGYDSSFFGFEEIEEVLKAVRGGTV